MDRRKLCRHMRPVMRRAHFYRSLPVGPTSGNGRWMAYPSQHFGCAFMSTRPSFYTLRPLRLIPCTAFSAEDPRLMDGAPLQLVPVWDSGWGKYNARLECLERDLQWRRGNGSARGSAHLTSGQTRYGVTKWCEMEKGWYRWVNSNHRPLDPQSSALTN
jgi:hypothetical protein